MPCPDVPIIGRFYNVNKSCQFNVGNPPIVQGLKSSQFRGPRVVRPPSEVGPSELLSS